MLGDNAFLLEQLGFGHTTVAQVSACTMGVVANYFIKSEVGVSYLIHAGCAFTLIDSSFRMGEVFSVQSTIPTFSSPSWTETSALPDARIYCIVLCDSIGLPS